ncbi:MAG: hypothetical protein ACRBCJ_01390 [Hyphomicrobiaceae bacterium]
MSAVKLNGLPTVACIALAMIATALPVAAEDCSKVVREAFAKQRKSTDLRMKSTMINQQGLVKMTVEYKLPSRMRQLVTRLGDTAPRETVLVGDKAWTRQGGGWNEVPKAYTDQLVKQVNDTVLNPPKDESFYECNGKETIDGQELLKFRGYETIKVPDEATNTVKNKVVKRDGAPVRLVYVDAQTGLPARNTVATSSKPDRPFFKAVFSYPTDLKIEAP